jgi:N6-L-threonylcarbamoyladenine synthase
LPRPLLDRPGCDFSFSGLKTAVLYAARKLDPGDREARADLARAFEEAAVDVLVEKSRRALAASRFDTLIVAGAVAANARLRAMLAEMAAAQGVRAVFPAPNLCTDNGAMIAHAGWRRLAAGERPGEAPVRARWPLQELESPG